MKEILTSIKRTPYQSLAAFLILFFTLFLSTTLFISQSFLYGLLGYVETRPQVTVYFDTATSEIDIFKIRDTLVSSGKVLSAKYINKDDAFKIYKDLNKDNPLLLEMVSADILPASLEIYAKKPVYLSEIAEFLKKQPATDEVQFQKNIIDRLLTLTNILRKSSITLFVYLILMSIVVLSTTTSFKIALKKDEIELLRLIGATKSYIKRPFLLEGAFFGFVSATLSFLLIVGAVFYLKPFLGSYLGSIPPLQVNLQFYQLTVWPLNPEFLLITFGLSLIFGVGVSVVATSLATRKYLNQAL